MRVQMTASKGSGIASVRARLAGLHKATKRLSSGRVAVYAYAFRGGPLVARGEGRTLADANALMERELGRPAALAKLDDARKPIQRKDSDRYVRGLIYAFKASPDYTTLGKATKADYERYLRTFEEAFGPERVSEVERARRELIEWANEAYEGRPRARDYALGTIGRLFVWAKDMGLAQTNPVENAKRLHKADRSDIIWTDADLARLCAEASKEVQWATRLAGEVGLRMGDLLALTWGEIGQEGIVRRTSKRKRQAVIPLTQEARRLLAEIPRVSPIVLTNSRGQPWTRDGFKSVFGDAKRDAKLDNLHFHDLRGTACTRLALWGCSDDDLALIFAWSKERVQQMKARYVSGDAIALDLLARMKQKPANTNCRQTGSSPKR
jgi:integrase